MIINHTEYVASQQRDVINQLWKNGFYKQIEEYRKSLKKCKQQLEEAAGRYPQHDKLSALLAALNNEFIEFLHDAIRFYGKLMTAVS